MLSVITLRCYIIPVSTPYGAEQLWRAPTVPVQVFYELHAERERQGKQNEVAIVRIEQLAPFPFDLVSREMRR